MSPTSLHLVAHAHTSALRRAVFGGDDSLDAGGLAAARALADTGPGRPGPFGRVDACLSTPAEAGRQTGYALGLRPTAVPALADCDYGRWTGLPLAEVAAREPEALRDWLGNPQAAPHGGESVEALLDRVDRWLAGMRDLGGRIVAVTHPVVVRAALVRALRLPAAAFWRLEVAPLAVVRLTGRGPGWLLRLTAPPGAGRGRRAGIAGGTARLPGYIFLTRQPRGEGRADTACSAPSARPHRRRRAGDATAAWGAGRSRKQDFPIMNGSSLPRIAVLGAGHVGPAIARVALAAGHRVTIAASGDPERIALITQILVPGVEARWAADAVRDADLVVLAIPLHRFADFDPALVAGKLVVDTMNYWPPTDGVQELFEDPRYGSSEIVARRLDRSTVVKTFNHAGYHQIEEERRPVGDPDRRALGVAGDDGAATDLVAGVVERIGYDAVRLESLAAGRLLEPGGPVFGASLRRAEFERAVRGVLR